VTNDLGHRIARFAGDQETLGAYRRGNRLPWIPGALITTWVPCPRSEVVTGVLAPHVLFQQARGESSADSGSIHCPVCRAELAVIRATNPYKATDSFQSSVATADDQVKQEPAAVIIGNQTTLPF
jgi:hypothetical protein